MPVVFCQPAWFVAEYLTGRSREYPTAVGEVAVSMSRAIAPGTTRTSSGSMRSRARRRARVSRPRSDRIWAKMFVQFIGSALCRDVDTPLGRRGRQNWRAGAPVVIRQQSQLGGSRSPGRASRRVDDPSMVATDRTIRPERAGTGYPICGRRHLRLVCQRSWATASGRRVSRQSGAVFAAKGEKSLDDSGRDENPRPESTSLPRAASPLDLRDKTRATSLSVKLNPKNQYARQIRFRSKWQ